MSFQSLKSAQYLTEGGSGIWTIICNNIHRKEQTNKHILTRQESDKIKI